MTFHALLGSFALLATLAVAQQKGPITTLHQISHSITADPSMSPDGKRMVFLSVVAGKEQLFASNVDGSDVVQLTQDAADHEDPAWSPDGKKIAYVLMTGKSARIYLMNVDGTGAEPLTPPDIRTIHPNWSPDGTKLAYCSDDDLQPPRKNDADIFTIDIASRKIVKLITGGVNTYPAWSPDGKQMAFRRMIGETNSEVFIADIDGGNQKNITNDPAFDGWPSWSPDGKLIAFASNRGRSYEVYVMKPDGTDVRKVAHNEGRATAPQWSKDGKMILYPVCAKKDFGVSCEIYGAKLDAFSK